MKAYKSLLIIWAVALVVGAGCVLYVNWCIDAIGAQSSIVEAVGVSDTATIPQLQVSKSVVVGVESFGGGDDNIGYRVQPAQSKVQ